MRGIKLLFLILIYSSVLYATPPNPISSVTPTDTILSLSGSTETYGVSCGALARDNTTYYMVYMGWANDLCSGNLGCYANIATASIASFPGSMTHTGTSLPMPSDPDYYTNVVDPYVMFDPISSNWYIWANTSLISGYCLGPYNWGVGHLRHSGTLSTFPTTEWSWIDYNDFPFTICFGFDFFSVVPKPGGGWVFFLCENMNASRGIYMSTTDSMDLDTATWTTPVRIINDSDQYIEAFVFFIYNGNYYILENTMDNFNAYLPFIETLWGSSELTTGWEKIASSVTDVNYITGLWGTTTQYSLNSGTMYGVNTPTGPISYPMTISAFTISATPISNPEPSISLSTSALNGSTLTATGTATAGPGGALWVIGWYNSTTGGRGVATGTTSWSASIPVNSAEDAVTVTAYNVAMESSSVTLEPPVPQQYTITSGYSGTASWQ